MKNFLHKIRLFLGMRSPGKVSFSQCGEDVIVAFILNKIGVKHPTYIDVGAHDPLWISNTALFHARGCRGINIEPNPVLYKNFVRSRKRDVNLNIGIADRDGELDFYSMDNSALSTFSKDAANELVRDHGARIREVIKVKTRSLTSVIAEYAGGVFPDFLSLDVEGLDMDILRSIDYSKSAPKVICVETISYSTTGHGAKDNAIITFLQDKGYMVFADTYINTIFVKRALWEK